MNSIREIFPMTEMQKGMLFHSVMEPNSGIYCEQFMFEVNGALDHPKLSAAWQKVVDSNDILRISAQFRHVKEPVQIVHDGVASPVKLLDLTGKPEDAQLADLEAFLEQDRHNGFALEEPAMIRAHAIKMEEERHIFLLTYHHLILDAWSLFLLMKELVECYDVGGQVGKVSPYYSDYVANLRTFRGGETAEFWQNYLNGYEDVTVVSDLDPANAPTRNSLSTHKEIVYRLDNALTDQIVASARSGGYTLNTYAQAAWSLAIADASGDDDVVFGITITHRPHQIENIDKMVGIFINSLPKRLRVDPAMPVKDFLSYVQNDQMEIKQHEHIALPDIQNASQIPGGQPIFETLMIFENFLKNPSWRQASDFTVDYYRYVGWTNYPLAIEVMPPLDDAPLYFQVKFDTNYFTEARVYELLDAYRDNLRSLTDADTLVLGDLATVGPKEAKTPVAKPAIEGAAAPAGDAAINDQVAAIWAQVLNTADVPHTQSFFDVGGTSLLLFEVQAHFFAQFDVDVEIVDLFDNPTVQQQADLLVANGLKISETV